MINILQFNQKKAGKHIMVKKKVSILMESYLMTKVAFGQMV